MAHTKVFFEHPHTCQMREAPVGFSWTTLFFGCFPALLRSDFKWGIIMIVASMLTAGISLLVFPFVYNDLYLKDLIKDGFKAKSVSKGTLEELSYKARIRIPTFEGVTA